MLLFLFPYAICCSLCKVVTILLVDAASRCMKVLTSKLFQRKDLIKIHNLLYSADDLTISSSNCRFSKRWSQSDDSQRSRDEM